MTIIKPVGPTAGSSPSSQPPARAPLGIPRLDGSPVTDARPSDRSAAKPSPFNRPAVAMPANGFPLAGLRPAIVNPSAPASFTGAIFDLDGTLVDSMEYWENLGPDYLRSRGKTPQDVDRTNFKQLTLAEAAAYIKNAYDLPETPEAIYDDIIARIEEAYLSAIPLKPGVNDMLEALDAAGVRMCIATASEKRLVVPMLERLGIAERFQGIYTCPEVGVSKSRPDVFEWALRELGTPIEETIVFEDSLHAIKTAKEAGFHVIAVHERTASHDIDIIETLSDAVVASFANMRQSAETTD